MRGLRPVVETTDIQAHVNHFSNGMALFKGQEREITLADAINVVFGTLDYIDTPPDHYRPMKTRVLCLMRGEHAYIYVDVVRRL